MFFTPYVEVRMSSECLVSLSILLALLLVCGFCACAFALNQSKTIMNRPRQFFTIYKYCNDYNNIFKGINYDMDTGFSIDQSYTSSSKPSSRVLPPTPSPSHKPSSRVLPPPPSHKSVSTHSVSTHSVSASIHSPSPSPSCSKDSVMDDKFYTQKYSDNKDFIKFFDGLVETYDFEKGYASKIMNEIKKKLGEKSNEYKMFMAEYDSYSNCCRFPDLMIYCMLKKNKGADFARINFYVSEKQIDEKIKFKDYETWFSIKTGGSLQKKSRNKKSNKKDNKKRNNSKKRTSKKM